MASLTRRTYTDKKTGKRRKTKKWYGKFIDADGVKRRVPLSTNRTAAEQMLNELVRKAEMGKAGILDPFEEHRARPLTEHLAAWGEVLRARGNTEKHIGMKLAQVGKIINLCKFKFIADISASQIEATLARLREKSKRFGTQTSNHYLTSAKGFTRWLVKDRRTAENPLAHLEGGNVRLDRRHERRDYTDDELARLCEGTVNQRSLSKLTGPDRAMLYTVAAYTGLRASELASLHPEDFNLGDAGPTVTVTAGYSKHRREDVIPLHPDLVRRLRPYLTAKPAGLLVWPGKWATQKRAGQILKRDAKAIRKAWIEEATDKAERTRREGSDFLTPRDSRNRVIDFHSLRHSFVSLLVKGGVKPKGRANAGPSWIDRPDDGSLLPCWLA